MTANSANSQSRKIQAGAWLLLFGLLAALVLWQSGQWAYRQGLEKLAAESRVQLTLYVAYLQGVLEKYEVLPELLATNQRLVDFLSDPSPDSQAKVINRYLEEINQINGASDTYLMNADGRTLAASNWRGETSFVGKNFSFRPYFQQAMQGKLGRYFAIGTTSNKRGYYFAYPVRRGVRILGAVVVKIDMSELERHWGENDQVFMVTDTDGVVFLSSRPSWLFRSLGQLPAATLERINASRRYTGKLIEGLLVLQTKQQDDFDLITLAQPPGFTASRRSVSFMQQTQDMGEAGWRVQVLSDTHPVELRMGQALTAASVLMVLLYMGFQLLRYRRRLYLDRRCYEQQARQTLQDANDRLEARVAERTRELTETNDNLRQTRDELIQAAKLATLGQMSAGINHELNQPLAAIRSYADNGRLLLDRDRLDEVRANLVQIAELTERMGQIGAQFKVFSRKTTGQINNLPLRPVIDGALRILTPAIRKAAAQVHTELTPEDLMLRGNDVLLQQVLVNLVGNALQAMEASAERQVTITAGCREGKAVIVVEDTGPGIAEEHLPKIFEPFFTTKKAGQGLGLGLSITYRIIEEMQGSIHARPGPQGARFEITLPMP